MPERIYQNSFWRSAISLLVLWLAPWLPLPIRAQSLSLPQDQYAEVNGIRLHYLDWGGNGPVMLLIPGLWSTAHAYDALAPLLTDRNRVVAVTRREHGSSQKNTGTISLDLLVDDLSDFLRLFTAEPAVVVGQSFAGTEMPVLARQHPDQVAALIFLDAVYDWAMWGRDEEPPFPSRWGFPADFVSLGAMDAWFGEIYAPLWSDVMRATLRSQTYLAEDGTVRWQFPWDDPKVLEFNASYRHWRDGAYAGIDVPVLSIQADFVGYFERDAERTNVPAEDLRAARVWAAYDREAKRRGREQLAREVPTAEHDLLTETHHWLQIQRPEAVADRMKTFLAALPAASRN